MPLTAAIIKEIDDKTILTLALIENLQRTDLNPVEEGEGYYQLSRDFGMTQQQIAETVGKDRTTIANMLRVLQLPNSVRTLLEEGKLTLGHAKVLVGLEDAAQITRLAREIVADGLTVRELERRLRGEAAPSDKKRPGRPRKTEQRPEVRRLEDRLRRFLQTDVGITVGKNHKGTVTIHFFSADDLERLLELLKVPD